MGRNLENSRTTLHDKKAPITSGGLGTSFKKYRSTGTVLGTVLYKKLLNQYMTFA